MNDVTIIDQFIDTFSRYIDSGFGLLHGEEVFLTATLIAIDMTIVGLYWAMRQRWPDIRQALLQACPDLKLSNRPVRTRMPGGVAGVQPIMAAPYADGAGRGVYWNATSAKLRSLRLCRRSTPPVRRISTARMPISRCC